MLFNDPTLFHSTFLTFLQDLCSILAPIQPKNGLENIRNQNFDFVITPLDNTTSTGKIFPSGTLQK